MGTSASLQAAETEAKTQPRIAKVSPRIPHSMLRSWSQTGTPLFPSISTPPALCICSLVLQSLSHPGMPCAGQCWVRSPACVAREWEDGRVDGSSEMRDQSVLSQGQSLEVAAPWLVHHGFHLLCHSRSSDRFPSCELTHGVLSQTGRKQHGKLCRLPGWTET